MNRKIKSTLILIVSLIFFYTSTYPLFQAQIKTESSLPQETALRKLPPELVFTTVLLGGFRGILVDILWMRARQLQEEGKYFELVQLSDWIGLLEPYIPEIWVFNAWNLSFNISVEFPTPEERWNWIYQGIKLVRDKALKYLPDSAKIYQEISWIHFNKISGSIDDFHAYYKRSWARIMSDALGNMKVAEIASHTSYEELVKDQDVQATVKSFQDQDIDLFADWEKIAGDGFSELPEELRDYLETPSFRKIEAYLRAKTLRETLKLEPSSMAALEEKYAPLDWKSAAAHSLYWIEEGKKKTDISDIEYQRMVYFSLNHLLEWGKIDLLEMEDQEIIMISPDLSIAPVLNEYYKEVLKNAPEQLSRGIESSHRSFLRKVIILSYTTNNLPTAHRYYRYLKETYPGAVDNLSFSEYLSRHFINTLKDGTIPEITGLLSGILEQAYWYLAVGEDEKFFGREALARLIYTRVSREYERFQRLFPTFETLKQSVRERVLVTFQPPLANSLRNRLEKDKTPTP